MKAKVSPDGQLKLTVQLSVDQITQLARGLDINERVLLVRQIILHSSPELAERIEEFLSLDLGRVLASPSMSGQAERLAPKHDGL